MSDLCFPQSALGRYGDSLHVHLAKAFNEWCVEHDTDVIDTRELVAAVAVLFVQVTAIRQDTREGFEERMRGAAAYLEQIAANQSRHSGEN